MTNSYDRLPGGWKRLFGVAYVLIAIWAAQDNWKPEMLIETLFVVAIISAVYWIAVLVLVWVIDGFR